MPHQLGPIEIVCDAPPYVIVEASREIGIESPQDVRWCRMSHFLSEHAGWAGFFTPAWGRAAARTCTCREKLPDLEKYTFLFLSGHEADYLLGQCRRCHTVFWEEV